MRRIRTGRRYEEQDVLKSVHEEPQPCTDAVKQPAAVLLDPVDECLDGLSHGQSRQFH
jgi:hypothetical protein